MKKKMLLALATSVMVIGTVLILSGCTTFDNFKEAFFADKGSSSDTIKIGVLEPQTGDDSTNAQYEIDGIELANKVAPTVNGKKIELVYADTQSSIYTAETAIQDLITKEPAVILGSYGDAASVVAGQYIEDAKIPAITITATNPLITLNNAYYFRTSFSEASQGYALADYVVNQLKQTTSAAIKVRDDDTSASLIAKYENKLTELTDNPDALVATVEIDRDATDYTEYIDKLKDSGAKSVFMPVDIKTVEKVFASAEKNKISDITFILPKDLHGDELISLQDKYPNTRIAVASDFNNLENEEEGLYGEFIKAYHKKFGKDAEPDDKVALGFDAYMLAVKAIDDADSVKGKNIRDALLATSAYEGASGEITFNENGDPTKSINIDVIKNGVFVSVYTVK